MPEQNESHTTRVLRKYIDANANLTLRVAQLEVELDDYRQLAQNLQAELNSRGEVGNEGE